MDKVTGAELEGEIPSYAEHDDFLVKVPALKELLCRGGFRHRWPLAPQGELFKFAPEPVAATSSSTGSTEAKAERAATIRKGAATKVSASTMRVKESVSAPW